MQSKSEDLALYLFALAHLSLSTYEEEATKAIDEFVEAVNSRQK